jgi:hypothetical protein
VFHVPGERVRVHGDFGVVVRTEKLRAFHTDGAIAKSRTFGRAGDDTDVLGHDLTLQGLKLLAIESSTITRAKLFPKVSCFVYVLARTCAAPYSPQIYTSFAGEYDTKLGWQPTFGTPSVDPIYSGVFWLHSAYAYGSNSNCQNNDWATWLGAVQFK